MEIPWEEVKEIKWRDVNNVLRRVPFSMEAFNTIESRLVCLCLENGKFVYVNKKENTTSISDTFELPIPRGFDNFICCNDGEIEKRFN